MHSKDILIKLMFFPQPQIKKANIWAGILAAPTLAHMYTRTFLAPVELLSSEIEDTWQRPPAKGELRDALIIRRLRKQQQDLRNALLMMALEDLDAYERAMEKEKKKTKRRTSK